MQNLLKKNRLDKITNAEVRKNLELAAQVFDKYGDAIRKMIRFHVNDESMVDDIFQDFFLSLVRRPLPSGIQYTKAYLCKAVRNDVLDKAFRTKDYHSLIHRYANYRMGRVIYDNPENIVLQAEQSRKLSDLIKKHLLPHEAEAVIQRYIYNRNSGDAAEAMCINRRSFSRYVCKGLKKIRKFIRENEKNSDILSYFS